MSVDVRQQFGGGLQSVSTCRSPGSAAAMPLPLLLLPLLVLPPVLTSGQEPFVCPQFPSVPNFDQKRFMEHPWFEYKSTPGPSFKYKGDLANDLGNEKCRYGYQYDAGNGKILFCNRGVRVSDKEITTSVALATPVNKTVAHFNFRVVFGGTGVLDLLDLDYDSHAILSICRADLSKIQIVVMTRARNPILPSVIMTGGPGSSTDIFMWMIESRLEELRARYGLNTAGMEMASQENCPEPVKPRPVYPLGGNYPDTCI